MLQAERGDGVTWKGADVRVHSFNAVHFWYLFLENVLKIWKGLKNAWYDMGSIEPALPELLYSLLVAYFQEGSEMT